MPQKVQRLSYFSVMMYHLTGERAYRGSADSPAGFLKLTTTGRKSGKQRSTHLIYIRDGSAYVVTASNGGRQRHPGWFYNARSNPQVTIQVQDTTQRSGRGSWTRKKKGTVGTTTLHRPFLRGV